MHNCDALLKQVAKTVLTTRKRQLYPRAAQDILFMRADVGFALMTVANETVPELFEVAGRVIF